MEAVNLDDVRPASSKRVQVQVQMVGEQVRASIEHLVVVAGLVCVAIALLGLWSWE